MKTQHSKLIAAAILSLGLLVARNAYSAFMNAGGNGWSQPPDPAIWSAGGQVQGANNDAFLWTSWDGGYSISGTYQLGWRPIGGTAYHDPLVIWSGSTYSVNQIFDGTAYDGADVHMDPTTAGVNGNAYAWAN